MKKANINILIQDTNRYFTQGLAALLQSACQSRQITMTFLTENTIYLADLIMVSNDIPSFISASRTGTKKTKQIVLLPQDRAALRGLYEAGVIKRRDSTNIVLQLINVVFKKYNDCTTNRAPHHISVLTPRELQVLSGIEQGLQPARIARQLRINVKTVSTHKCSVIRKLGFSGNHQLYYWLRHHNALVKPYQHPRFPYHSANEAIVKSTPVRPHSQGL
ncbi:TPA: response regulator transcription factor [Serratia fonticola]